MRWKCATGAPPATSCTITVPPLSAAITSAYGGGGGGSGALRPRARMLTARMLGGRGGGETGSLLKFMQLQAHPELTLAASCAPPALARCTAACQPPAPDGGLEASSVTPPDDIIDGASTDGAYAIHPPASASASAPPPPPLGAVSMLNSGSPLRGSKPSTAPGARPMQTAVLLARTDSTGPPKWSVRVYAPPYDEDSKKKRTTYESSFVVLMPCSGPPT